MTRVSLTLISSREFDPRLEYGAALKFVPSIQCGGDK